MNDLKTKLNIYNSYNEENSKFLKKKTLVYTTDLN